MSSVSTYFALSGLPEKQLELAKHITPYTIAETLLSRAPHIHVLPQFCYDLLVVWSANEDGSALTSKSSSKVNLLNDDNY